MEINILLFGIAKESIGGKEIKLEIPANSRVFDLKMNLKNSFPLLEEIFKYSVAVNLEYACDQYMLMEGDEVAIIPPVSGG